MGTPGILLEGGAMVTRILYLQRKTYKQLIRLRKQAERDGPYRVAKRLQAVVLNSEGRTSGELAHLLAAPRSRVSEWLAHYQAFGVDGLLEGHRSGRPLELTPAQRKQLDDILHSGPVAYGLEIRIWTSPLVASGIGGLLGIYYNSCHERRL